MALSPEHLDKVMHELVAVSASATSKREEAANLARIWGGRAGTGAPAGARPPAGTSGATDPVERAATA